LAIWAALLTSVAVGIEPSRDVIVPSDPLTASAVRATARLNDIQFVDPQHGWAVGDRGTIWSTDDAGQRWQLQPSGVSCPLYSVWFINPQMGFAAGGRADPFLHRGSGVLLWTRDGGQHWQSEAKLVLPILKQIRFFDDRRGWAVGCASAMYPSGVFTTQSGGRDWQPLPGSAVGWLAGAFYDHATGVVAGRDGTVALAQHGSLETVTLPAAGLRSLTRLELVPPAYGWLIGDGGLVLMTADQGGNWSPPPGHLPQEVLRQFDLRAMAVRGPQCWIAGTPGTLVFHSPDAGRNWMAFPTGQSLPLYALSMIDDQHGWAAGALGTILATCDGGRSWQRQRGGGLRLAVLGVFSRPGDVPWELLVRLCGDEGYLGAVAVMNRQDIEVRAGDPVELADRLHEAAVATGADDASLDWRFPVRQGGLGLSVVETTDAWDAANDGKGLHALQAEVIRQVRLWRPDVIVTGDPGARGENAATQMVAEAVVEAARKAADSGALPEQLSLAGLAVWQVKKVVAALPPGVRGGAELPTAQLATRLGRSLADAAAGPRGLLANQFRVAPSMLGFHLAFSLASSEADRGDFIGRLSLASGGEARRTQDESAVEGLESVSRVAQRRRNFLAIIEQSEKSPQGGVQLLAQAGQLAEQLDDDGGAWLLYHLAMRYFQTGNWEMAAETFQLLAERHPQHPLSRAATLWLVQYLASGEAAWRFQGSQRYTVSQRSALAIDGARQEDRLAGAIVLGTRIEQTDPALFAEPGLRFPLAVAYRARGGARQAERSYAALSRGGSRGAWRECAEGEAWIAAPRGRPPKPVLHCPLAAAKPHLDGRLDDALWKQLTPAPLESAYHDDAQWPASVMLAHDDQFLYLAITARQAPGAHYEPATGQRPRDADLSTHDRVDVFLDVDRDFVTYYHFTIDHRGWAAEDCWGDRTWNPTWFVAVRSEKGMWTAEAAIPLNQLTGRVPQPHDVWAVGIQRTVPGVGFQAWNTPAAVEVIPEGFGYLEFQ
jgi:photosystem II stability/assembly factor-like uncharacterized protein